MSRIESKFSIEEHQRMHRRSFRVLLMQLIFKERYNLIFVILLSFLHTSRSSIVWIIHRIILLPDSDVLYAHVRSYAIWIFAWNWLHDDQHRQAYLNSNPPNSIYFTLHRGREVIRHPHAAGKMKKNISRTGASRAAPPRKNMRGHRTAKWDILLKNMHSVRWKHCGNYFASYRVKIKHFRFCHAMLLCRNYDIELTAAIVKTRRDKIFHCVGHSRNTQILKASVSCLRFHTAMCILSLKFLKSK